jgi:hypothetical protein
MNKFKVGENEEGIATALATAVKASGNFLF